MSISVNDGGVLRVLDAISANDGGVLRSQQSVHANDGGVLRAIFKSAMKAVWTSFHSAYATILSTANGKNFTTVTYSINYASTSTTPNTVKCTFDMKAGQTLHAEQDINKTGGSTSTGTSYLYDGSGKQLATWHNMDKDVYTVTQDMEGCYMVFYARKSSSDYTATQTITLTLK